MTEKNFSNKQLKLLILDLYISHNITINDNIKKQINISSKTKYYTLEKLYQDIKLYLENNISKSSSSISSDEEIDNKIEIEIKIEKDYIKEDILEDYKNIKIELFNNKQMLNKLEFKCKNYKNIIKEINNKKINRKLSEDSTENFIEHEEKRLKNYNQMIEMSSYNIIKQLGKLNNHELKVLYNRYFSNKLKRKLD